MPGQRKRKAIQQGRTRGPKRKLCGSCRKDCYPTDVERTLGRDNLYWGRHHKVAFDHLPESGFNWACDDCLVDGSAIVADPLKQLFCDQAAYLAYWDHHNTCQRCAAEYTFSKEEQQHWYEELQFWVMSYPKHCKACRQAIREEKQRNTELSKLLHEQEQLSPEGLERIAELYSLIERHDKATAFARKADRLRKKRTH